MSRPAASSGAEVVTHGAPAAPDTSAAPDIPESPVAAEAPPAHPGPLDELARRVLGLRDAEPRALVDLQGSLVVSAVRCILAYVVVPIALPLVAWADVVATPASLVLSIVAVLLGVRSLRRVWQANWTHRWTYTAFIAVVVVLLGITITVDVATLLA